MTHGQSDQSSKHTKADRKQESEAVIEKSQGERTSIKRRKVTAGSRVRGS